MKNKTPLIDEKTFFHEATVKICGTLEIDKALSDFFHYAKQYLPVNKRIIAATHRDLFLSTASF